MAKCFNLILYGWPFFMTYDNNLISLKVEYVMLVENQTEKKQSFCLKFNNLTNHKSQNHSYVKFQLYLKCILTDSHTVHTYTQKTITNLNKLK